MPASSPLPFTSTRSPMKMWSVCSISCAAPEGQVQPPSGAWAAATDGQCEMTSASAPAAAYLRWITIG